MQSKIAVIGSTDFVMPYAAMGADCFEVEDDQRAVVEAAEKIAKQKYTLIIASEPAAKMAESLFEKFNKKATPCVLVLPFTNEPEGFAVDNLSKLLKAATGIDILQNT